MKPWVLVLVCALLVVTGCSDGSPTSIKATDTARVGRVNGIPVRIGATKGAGTKLGNGFTVVDGSRLLGDVFPTEDRRSYDGRLVARGWTAHLVVARRPAEVVAHYAHQAEAARLERRSFACGADQPPVGGYYCSGQWVTGATRLRSMTLMYAQGTDGPAGAPFSHLVLNYREPLRSPDGPPTEAQPVLPPIDVPPLEAHWPKLPEVGDAYDFGGDMKPLPVPGGVKMIAQPGPSTHGSGSSAVFVVDSEPEELLESYLPSRGVRSKDVKRREGTRGAAKIKEAYWTNGHTFEAALVSRPGQPTFLVLDHAVGD